MVVTMSDASAKKILDKWRKQVPPEADVQDVLAVIDSYLSEWTRDVKGPGSHLKVVYHPMFQRLNLFDGNGGFSVAMHKKRVKKCYIKDILTAIDTLQMMRKVDGSGSQ